MIERQKARRVAAKVGGVTVKVDEVEYHEEVLLRLVDRSRPLVLTLIDIAKLAEVELRVDTHDPACTNSDTRGGGISSNKSINPMQHASDAGSNRKTGLGGIASPIASLRNPMSPHGLLQVPSIDICCSCMLTDGFHPPPAPSSPCIYPNKSYQQPKHAHQPIDPNAAKWAENWVM